MTNRIRICIVLLVSVWMNVPGVAAQSHAATPAPAQKEGKVLHAKGTFEVKLVPQKDDNLAGHPALGRMSINKDFHGDLQGSSVGEMLTGGTDVKGSGAYVAIEQVTGTLNGRSGTFLLQHRGVMTKGAPELLVTVVPDSGTGQLTGLAGNFNIIIADGKHSYDFEYTLPEGK
jgi:hypothetical protein